MKKIMFTDSLTKAILRGDKTMTRRIVPEGTIRMAKMEVEVIGGELSERIKEHAYYCYMDKVAIAQRYKDAINPLDWVNTLIYKDEKGWENKMFVRADMMPHQIEITDIKLERLQDISDGDCLREGIFARHDVIDTQMRDVIRYQYPDTPHLFKTPKEAFAHLIDKVSKKGTWASNPFVFAYSFKLIK